MPWLLLALAGLYILNRRAEVMNSPTREQLERLAIRIAREEGLPDPVPFLALIDTESSWDHRAKNCSGGDGQRGCSWGLPQITLLTAREMDDRGPTNWREIDPERGGEALLKHPALALKLGARYFVGAYQLAQKENPANAWPDAAARYNAGWARGLVNAPNSTREVYVPRFERNLSRRRS